MLARPSWKRIKQHVTKPSSLSSLDHQSLSATDHHENALHFGTSFFLKVELSDAVCLHNIYYDSLMSDIHNNTIKSLIKHISNPVRAEAVKTLGASIPDPLKI